MYESYYQLDCKPFEPTSDERFHYPSEVHQGVMLKLRYAIENRRPAAVLTGESGLGKTLMARSLCRQLPEEFSPIAHVVFPHMPPEELAAYLADELDAGRVDGASNGGMSSNIRRMETALIENAKQGKHAVLVLDEAHLLAETYALDMVRLLLNIEHDSKPTMTLVLVGATSLLPSLERNRELESRVAIKCLARPFRLEETASYINHRMTAAGAKRTIFSSDALDAVHELSRGATRRINRICDLALLIGFAEEIPEMSADHLFSVVEEMVAVSPE